MTGSSSGCCRHKRVAAILLCSHDGAAFVASQLHSLHDQDHARIDLLVSDDGSSDGTVALLEEWAKRWAKGRFHIVSGLRQGFAENSRQAILACPGADYVFFCDQDDLWDRSKVTAAIAALEGWGPTPALYCSRTRLVDAAGRGIGLSPLRRGRPSFRNALAQCIARGNTMALNAAGFALVQDALDARPSSAMTGGPTSSCPAPVAG